MMYACGRAVGYYFKVLTALFGISYAKYKYRLSTETSQKKEKIGIGNR